MAKVLRLTRHPLGEGQEEALREAAHLLTGCPPEEVSIVQVRETIEDASQVLALVEEHGAQVLEAVLPLPLLAQVVGPLRERGVPVIRAVMARELTPEGEARFTFLGYELIEEVRVVAHPLTPSDGGEA